METNNTTVANNATSTENKVAELKINFTDTELQSIAINAMGRSSEAGKQTTTNISNFIKLFLVFFCSMNFAYGEKMEGNYTYDKFYEYSGIYKMYEMSCLLPESLNDPKCLHQVYQELDSRLNQAYKNIMNSTIYPQANKTALKNSQIAWIKAKEAECKKFSKNKDKLTSCYLDKTIDKINKLWQIEANVIEKPFEGKWMLCDYRCGMGIPLLQKGNNICGTYPDRVSNQAYMAMWLFRIKDERKIAFAIRGCNMQGYYSLIDCKTKNGTDLPFKDWHKNATGRASAFQFIEKEGFGYVKTPFTQDELNELSKIQWLQDCLNYKGE